MKESSLQIAVAKYLDNTSYIHNSFAWSHPPNEGKRTKAQGWHLKNSGLKAGEADCIIYPVGRQAFFIELKTKKGRLTESQKLRKGALERLGFTYYVVKAENHYDAVNQVEGILKKEELL